jgi:competence protein ComEC
VRDDAGHEYTVPEGVTLDPDAQITLHTGSGTNTAADLYWGSGPPIWNNDGDTVIVTTDEGTEILREAYT